MRQDSLSSNISSTSSSLKTTEGRITQSEYEKKQSTSSKLRLMALLSRRKAFQLCTSRSLLQLRTITAWQKNDTEFTSPLQRDVAVEEEAPLSFSSGICFENLIFNRSKELKEKPKADPSALKFGAVTTDHMLQISWNEREGWLSPTVNPMQHISLHPCAQVLHYATECFEGMKAYKDRAGRVLLFRPMMHIDRLLSSAQRLALPEFNKAELFECIKELVRIERDWIPHKYGFSLYIRPTMIATQPCLGVQPPREVMLFVVLSPVGPYFPTGLKPIKLFVDRRNARAYPGGVGDKKLGGNYAQSIVPQMEAARRGCSQVLYVLPGTDRVGEAGTMNIFFLLRNSLGGELELVTPALDGTILPGVTRDTVLTLSKRIPGLTVSERVMEFSEIETAAARGDLLEAFGTGTACMIQPVTGLVKENGEFIRVPFDSQVANRWIGRKEECSELPFNLCGYLTRHISDIHYGYVPSDWTTMMD